MVHWKRLILLPKHTHTHTRAHVYVCAAPSTGGRPLYFGETLY